MTARGRLMRVLAPAKINLALHVVGRRDDGFHLLDTLVAFAGVGDVLDLFDNPPSGTLAVSGPEAEGVPADRRNLVLQTAAAFWPPTRPIRFALEKHLPNAAGIGGGSADAAACYRGIAMLRDERGDAADLTSRESIEGLVAIGADVPMCVTCAPVLARGIGERLTPVQGLPEFPIVLVNPRVPVPTAGVFDALTTKDNAPMEPLPPDLADAEAVLAWLVRQRNDLEAPARALVPPIGAALRCLQDAPGCRLARMSGSGATCFGLFEDDAGADAAASRIAAARPDWWVKASRLDGARRAEPQLIRATT